MLAAAVAASIHHATDPDNQWGWSQQVVAVLSRHGGPVAVGLGVVGLSIAIRFAEDRTLPWVWLGAEVLLATALKPGLRYDFYYARYLVADAIPVLVVGAAWFVGVAGYRVSQRNGAPLGLGAALVVALTWIATPLPKLALPVYWTRDLHDSPDQLKELFDHVPRDSVLFFDSRAPHRWRA